MRGQHCGHVAGHVQLGNDLDVVALRECVDLFHLLRVEPNAVDVQVGVVELVVAHLPEEGLPPGEGEVPGSVVHQDAAHLVAGPVLGGAGGDHLGAGEQLQHTAGAVEHAVRCVGGDGQRPVDLEPVTLLAETQLVQAEANIALLGLPRVHRDLGAGEVLQLLGNGLGDSGQLLIGVPRQHDVPAEGEVLTRGIGVPLLQRGHDLHIRDIAVVGLRCGRGRHGGHGQPGEQRWGCQQGGQSSGGHLFSSSRRVVARTVRAGQAVSMRSKLGAGGNGAWGSLWYHQAVEAMSSCSGR